jgi:hypothetical protein
LGGATNDPTMRKGRRKMAALEENLEIGFWLWNVE